MRYVLNIYLPGLLLGPYFVYVMASKGLLSVVLIGWALVSGLGIAVGFHRVYSHKTHKLKPWLDNLVLVLGTLGGQGSSVSWVAVHRGYHHRFSDTEKDLHSPVNGFWNSFIGWYWSLTPETINHKYAAELLRRPLHVFVHKNYLNLLTLFILVLTNITLWTGIPVAQVYLAVLGLSLVQDNLVNTLCHQPWLGYRNFRLNDNSNNFWLLGYFGWGQGWHENHHALPGKFSFRTRWWEFDACVLYLPLLKLGSSRNPNS